MRGRTSSPRLALALEAMATRFELLLCDEGDPARLRAAGEEALAGIARAEALWSRYLPTSEIAWVNAAAGRDPVRVSPPTLRLLARCAELARLTDGAFDPTVGPLVRLWAAARSEGRLPEPRAIARARSLVGMDQLELDEAASTARLPRRGMALDLGGIGKGAALDDAIGRLAESGIRSALLHGGTSSVHVLGAWQVGWRVPGESEPRAVALDAGRPALAVSAPHGRSFLAGGRRFGHVIDPRTGEPTHATAGALARGPSSELCDALSTALLVLGVGGPPLVRSRFSGFAAEVAPAHDSIQGPPGKGLPPCKGRVIVSGIGLAARPRVPV